MNTVYKILKKKILINKNKLFLSFEDPEHHFNKYPEHTWIKTSGEILTWLKNFDEAFELNKEDYEIHEDLTVSYHGKFPIIFVKKNIVKIPIQFRKVNDFIAIKVNLISAIGTPYIVKNLNLDDNQISSFEGISGQVYKSLSLNNNKITNFIDMPDFEGRVSVSVLNNKIRNFNFIRGCDSLILFDDEYDKEKLKIVRDRGINIVFKDKDAYIKSSDSYISPRNRMKGIFSG